MFIFFLKSLQAALQSEALGRYLYQCTIWVLLLLLSSCASSQIQKDYERAVTMDTVSGYEEFIRKHPESEYKEQVSKRIQRLRKQNKLEKLKENQKRAEREARLKAKITELTAENINRIRKLNNYVMFKTKLTEFIDDGWNVEDPYIGKLGIVGILYDNQRLRKEKLVKIIMGFTYRRLEYNKDQQFNETVAKWHRAALESELARMKRQDVKNIQMSIAPMMTTKNGKIWTKREWDLHGDPQALEPFFESTAVVTFADGILSGIDLSGIKYVFKIVRFNCTITHEWLEKIANKSTKIPRPTVNDIANIFSENALGLDKVQISYDSLDEDETRLIIGNGTLTGRGWEEQLNYLITQKSLVFLPKDKQSILIKSAIFYRASRKLEFGLVKGLTIEYQCEEL